MQSLQMNASAYAAFQQPECLAPAINGMSMVDICSVDMTNFFLYTLNMAAAFSKVINAPCGHVKPIARPRSTYDFIVVGGGAAGPVVASRLSEIENWNVLLVEAGPDEAPGMQIPSNLQLYLNTDLDWKYKTVNEKHACLSDGGSCSWPRGKNLGGCTSHHGMAYHRGHKKDFDRWVKMGAEGWSWKEVLPFYTKSEDNREIGKLVDGKYHGAGGPMTVERFPWQPKFAKEVIEAAKEAGLGTTDDMVGDKITGFTIAQTISRNGVRLSSARAFLWPHRDRSNLDIALNATATKIITRNIGKKGKADGITLLMNGQRYTVMAKKEVILTAGSINSPQLLLLSGIGPKKHLDSVGIRTIVDLPGVGENLHNHVSFGVDFALTGTEMKEELTYDNSQLYLYNQTGPLSSTGMAQLTGIIASKFTTKNDPDIQIFFAGYQATCDTNGRIADLTTYENNQTVRFTVVNLQTRSRGNIKLASQDPLQHPIIWSNELSKPRDRKILYEGLKNIMELVETNRLQQYNMTLIHKPTQACDKIGEPDISNYKYWECQFRYNTRPENHQAGTCKMGDITKDPYAVVNPQLKVHNVDGLRVADASIMPQVVSGNPVAAVNMIGERAADFIKRDYGVI